jgi:hypothetical protein
MHLSSYRGLCAPSWNDPVANFGPDAFPRDADRAIQMPAAFPGTFDILLTICAAPPNIPYFGSFTESQEE